MRKKLLVILLLLVVLIVLVVTRCGGKKDQQNDPADGQGFAQQSGKAELPAELKLGVVTETESGAMQLEVEQNGEKTVYVFSDITINDWYVPAVNYVVTNGLMSGTDVGGGLSLFRPNYGMTRAQLAMILYRFAGGEPVAAPRHTYGDVSSGEWYYDCVNWADTNGYIKPESTDSFGVEAYCSCEEVLAVLHRLAGSPESNASLEDYPYAPKVSETNLSAVRWAWEKGLIAEDECVWYPTQAVSRAQIALLLMRYDQLIGASGEKLVTRDESGLPVSNIDSSKLVEVVMKYVDIINDKDSVISVQDNRIKDGGPAGVFDGGRMLFWETNLQRMKAARSFTVDFGLIPFPKYEESDEYIAPVGGYWDSWLMIPATNSDTDRTGTVLEALGYYSQQFVTPAFVETSVTTKALRDDDSAEMLDMVLKNRSFDAGIYFSWGTNEAFKASVNHVSNFTSVAASGKSKIDASIASFIEALGE